MSLNSQELFSYFLDANIKKIAVAISGGCDSMALTFLLNEFCKKNKIELFAITVDHKFRKNSSNEAQEVAKILQEKQIAHHILTAKNTDIFNKNIEANMRKVRYDLLHEFCQKKEIKYLFLGHHLGDVAENFLIRLFRGSGLDGLSTMAEISDFKDIKIVRPLLDVKKADLQNYLKEKNISWFEDESNNDEKFLRNKIRNFLNTFEEKDLIDQRIKNATDEISEIRDFFDEKMLNHAKEILEFTNQNQPKFLVNVRNLKALDEKYALKILALVFQEISQRNYKPRLKELKKFYQDLKEGNVRNFYGCDVFNGEKIAITAKEKSEEKLTEKFYFRTILRNHFF
ncbi:MAG: tRNA lysidine(34) synthetase TilS [Rickettsiales bacterium]|nr:tRNA lysidine(34) synthetase TilS [Rickettsiales bacterium]